MRESMARMTPHFSASRVVREYTEKHYLPAAKAYCERAANRGEMGISLFNWQQELVRHWSSLRLGGVNASRDGEQYTFKVEVYLGDLDPEAVRVELYAEGQNGRDAVRQAMERVGQLEGSAKGFIYSAHVPATRPANDYTPRVSPCRSGASVPLEVPLILWPDPQG
jgi:starch phosphorylase